MAGELRATTTDSVVDAIAAGVARGERAALGRAITLLESTLPDDERRAEELLARLGPPRGRETHRIGITGAPGVGKSTCIEALGRHVTSRGLRVAVLAVDPSSRVSGGSVLGDKTRMPELAREERAFIRPSPSRGTLGGVSARTREAIALCEAAGYDVVVVETVGTGQSEVAVAEMVDTYLLLLLPGAGDSLQGIKRGVMELADVLAVNKADGERVQGARLAAAEYRQALRTLRARDPGWEPPVLTLSARTGDGVAMLWETLAAHRAALAQSGALEQRRREQRIAWMWERVQELLRRELDARAADAVIAATEADVAAGRIAPPVAARKILSAFAGGAQHGGGA